MYLLLMMQKRYCFSDYLDRKKVKGNVMVCKMGGAGVESTIKRYGGAGAILVSDQYLDNAQIFMAPATSVNSSIGDVIYRYVNSSRFISWIYIYIYILSFKTKNEPLRTFYCLCLVQITICCDSENPTSDHPCSFCCFFFI